MCLSCKRCPSHFLRTIAIGLGERIPRSFTPIDLMAKKHRFSQTSSALLWLGLPPTVVIAERHQENTNRTRAVANDDNDNEEVQ